MSEPSTSQPEQENIPEDKSIFPEFVDKLVHVQTENCAFEGTCRSIDGYLNLVLENALICNKKMIEENSEKENKEDKINLKSCFISGGSIKHVNIPECK